MSATVSLQRNFPTLTELDLVTREDMRELGLLARERIISRTRQGLDANGNPFQPLSESYAKQKLEALGTDRADLTVSGNMLNHLVLVDVDDDSVTLGWNQ